MTGASDKTNLINEENLRAAFSVLDLNGDGFVTPDEISQRFAYSNLDAMVDH